jgi:hypothetical protein
MSIGDNKTMTKVEKLRKELKEAELQEEMKNHYPPEFNQCILDMREIGWEYDFEKETYPFTKVFDGVIVGIDIEDRKVFAAQITREFGPLKFAEIGVMYDAKYESAVAFAKRLKPTVETYSINVSIVESDETSIAERNEILWELFNEKLDAQDWWKTLKY